jgi:hypothetical protein
VVRARSALGWLGIQSCIVTAFIGCSEKSATRKDDAAGPLPEAGSVGDGGVNTGGRGGADAGIGNAAANLGGSGGAGSAGQGGASGSAGGAGATGGAGSGGVAGSAGMPGADGSAADSCVKVSGGGDAPWYDLTVVGTQFGADEGAHIRIAVATQTGNRVGIGDLPIVGGAFTFSMPQVLNAGWYVGITLYVDRNHNDVCETGEHLWDWTTKIVNSNMRFDVTPNQLCDKSLMNCRPRSPTQQACWVGSGDTDLRQPLPCVR